MSEIRECPLCGAEVSWIRIGAAYRVACRCGAEGPAYDNEAAAIAAWNQRYLPMTYSVDNATVTVNDLHTATLFRKQEAELVALRALREACFGLLGDMCDAHYEDDEASDANSDAARWYNRLRAALGRPVLAECEKASPDTSDEHKTIAGN